MKLENEDALDNFIICHKCYTLNEEHPIKDGSSARCSECGNVLYQYDSRLITNALALSIAGLIFFILANVFPLVQMDILGSEQFITIPKTIFSLLDSGFYLVGLLCAFLVFIFPLMIFVINIILFTLLTIKRGEKLTKELLILLSHVTPWSMADIFFISILVAIVKLVAFGQIHIGISFWALMAFVVIDVYITKSIRLSEIWMLRKKILLEGERQ
ncbi:MAG: paraquat-inducible protein A [Epsilonproteobacteria bacterium]|nr:MAG: paraquat-inducible protein A [Campylobacterota bacterium]